MVGVVVNPETVSQRVKLVRDALEDDPHAPRYIAGVRGRGYRMLPPVVPLCSSRALTPDVADVAIAEAPTLASSLENPQVSVSGERASRWRWAIAAVAAAALIATGAAAVIVKMRERDAVRSDAVQVTAVAQPAGTLAVLPFVNTGGDPENEYLSDSLTDELLHRLTRVPGLRIAARNSSYYFKDRSESVRQIGQMLGVRYVLEGSVRRHGDSIRVSARLIGTQDAFRHWSNEYEGRVSDIYAIEDRIVHAVVAGVKLGPNPEELAALSRHSPTSPEAHDLYLRARHLYQSFQLQRMDKAISYYEEAIRLDPGFAAAYVGLADALGWRRLIGEMPQTDPVNARILVLLRKALELDPSSGDARALLGKELMFSYDFKGAERELHRAEELSPNGEYVVEAIMGYYMLVGWPPERAIAYARKGRQLDPLNPWAVIHVAQAHWHAHQYDEALLELERVFEIDPNYWLAHAWRAWILWDLDRPREALPAARRSVELNEGLETLDLLATAYAKVGAIDEAKAVGTQIEARGARKSPRFCLALKDSQCALDALERSFAERDRFFPEMLHYREMLPLHDEPRFQRLVRLLGQERRVEQAARLSQVVADVG